MFSGCSALLCFGEGVRGLSPFKSRFESNLPKLKQECEDVFFVFHPVRAGGVNCGETEFREKASLSGFKARSIRHRANRWQLSCLQRNLSHVNTSV